MMARNEKEQAPIVITAIECSDDYLKSILTNAVENPFGDWFEVKDIVRERRSSRMSPVIRAAFRGTYDDAPNDEWHVVNLADVKRGILKALEPEVLGVSYRAQILCDDNDAITSDAIVQCAVFGEVIYG